MHVFKVHIKDKNKNEFLFMYGNNNIYKVKRKTNHIRIDKKKWSRSFVLVD